MAPRVTLICGITQQGKSTFALWHAIHEWDRVIVLDSARAKVFDRIAAGGQFATWPQLATWLATDGGRLRRWCVALRSKSPDDYAAALRAAEHLRGVLILCDETHKLVGMKGVREPLELCALTGAHYGGGAGVGLYMVAQRATSVPLNIRSQADRVVSFRQRWPADLKSLSEWWGSEDLASIVAALDDHQYVVFPPNTLTVRGSTQHEVAALGNDRARDRGRSGDRGAALPESTREAQRRDVSADVAEVTTAASAPVNGAPQA